jgi:hypothetical protein
VDVRRQPPQVLERCVYNQLPGFCIAGYLPGLHINIEQFVGQMADIQKSSLGKGALTIRQIQAGRETGDCERGHGYGHALAPQELARAIPDVARTGLHRPPVEKSTDIVCQSLYGRVAFFRLPAKGLA